MQKHVRNLVYAAVFAAIIALSALFLHIPLPMENGYCNLSDGIILLSGMLSPVWAMTAAAVGSMLADLLAGYAVYAPVTALIKGIMGLIAGKWIVSAGSVPAKILLMLLAEMLMVLGYMAFESIVFGWPAALMNLPGNGCQAAAGIAVALALQEPLKKYSKVI